LIIGYLYGLQLMGKGDSKALSFMLMVMIAEAIVGLSLVVGILIDPRSSHARRWCGMVADYSTLAVLMLLEPKLLAPLYVIVLWVTIGNGLRYGARYLKAATLLGLAAFLLVVWRSEYWREQSYLAGGLWFGLLAIPAYLSSLLRSLRQSTEEAKRANAAKSRFLATMSHELRSPLNGIIGMAELMRNSRLPADQREYAEVIHTSAQTLLLLVDEVLDISAIEAGKLQRKEVDFNLNELVSRLQKMLRPQAAAKELDLRMDIEPEVPLELHGDSGHLTQILLNLLNNAIKFTEAGSVTLHVSRSSSSQTPLSLIFSVRDTGIGIPDEYKLKIFEAFEQVDTGPTRRYGGTGLGTTIAKTLTQLLGGTISLEDNPGGGSVFRVEIPFAEVNSIHVFPERDTTNVVAFDDPFIRHKARVKPLRVLVADDQHANRTVLSRILEHAGHKVSVAADGEQSLDLFENQHFDLAVLDMHMPGVSGLDVIRQLRFMQAGYLARTPVIVMSADATEQAMKDATAAGAMVFLTKPIVVAKFLEVVAELAGRQSAGDKPANNIRETLITNTNHPDVLEELAAMGLGRAFLADFVEQCLKDLAGCLDSLNRSAARANWLEFRDAAHAMKGVGENLGAGSITDRCRQIMCSDDATLARKRNGWIAELDAQLILVAEYSRKIVAKIADGSASSPDGKAPVRHQTPNE
jgi:two-component system sensor histidine kinase RpfC